MKQTLQLRQYIIQTNELEDTLIEKYSWIANVAKDNTVQKAVYLNYINDNLKSLLDTGLYRVEDVAQDGKLLTLSHPRLPFNVKGTTDVLIVKRHDEKPPSKLFGVCLTIELKKEIKDKNFH
ncbi:Crinkler (CRN) family protein [Thraustotheca clavata]|uniref:Crinkler (CRN) family protein n=1 Tax=Thraustotheca clavata TaxID=74557 RepID=A0A1V9ZHN4_9STRA|nr:Crinkler (CRN) family protein [Thraustotheca clavata]